MPSKKLDFKHTYHYFFRLLGSIAKLEEPQYYFVEMECYGNGLENPGKIHFIQLSPEMASKLSSMTFQQFLLQPL